MEYSAPPPNASDDASSGSEEDTEDVFDLDVHDENNAVLRNCQQFEFIGPNGVSEALIPLLETGEPFDFFHLLIDDNILEEIVEQTNLYATLQLLKKKRCRIILPTS
jgi:hypothetical protein